MKHITHVAIARTYTSMKARDVKNENQMKSSFFRGYLSPRKGKVSYFIPLLDKHNKNIKTNIHLLRESNEIRLQGDLVEESFYNVARKGR